MKTSTIFYGVQAFKWCKYCGKYVLDVFPSDAWQLAHGETIATMGMNEHMNSDEELMPSFYESDSPDSEDDNDLILIPLSLTLSFMMLDFNAFTVYLFRYLLPLELRTSNVVQDRTSYDSYLDN